MYQRRAIVLQRLEVSRRKSRRELEVAPGIEPGSRDLQSLA